MWNALLDGLTASIKFFHNFTGNYGLDIVLLTMGVRLILWPLTHAQAVSTKRMQELQPEIEKLRKKYKNDQQKVNAETMKLWKEHKVNPAAGCVPLVVQLPILFAIYRVLLVFPDFNGAAFLWVPNLAAADPIILPILTGVTTFWQSWVMTPRGSSQQPAQQMMIWIMPAMIFWISRTLPAGVGVYWVIGNLFTIGQHFLVPGKRLAEGGSKSA